MPEAIIDALKCGPHPPCRPRRVQHRAAAKGSSADKTAERDVVGAFRLSYAGNERELDWDGVEALPQDCEGLATSPIAGDLLFLTY